MWQRLAHWVDRNILELGRDGFLGVDPDPASIVARFQGVTLAEAMEEMEDLAGHLVVEVPPDLSGIEVFYLGTRAPWPLAFRDLLEGMGLAARLVSLQDSTATVRLERVGSVPVGMP